MSLKQAKTPEGKNAATQTDKDLIDDLNDLLDKTLRLAAELDEAQGQIGALQESNNSLSIFLRDANRDRRQMITTAGQQQTYFTAEG